jgi:putative phosphoribosyl transferase
MLHQHRIPSSVVEQVTREVKQELERRERVFAAHHPLPDLKDWVVILVDDGIATGATMRAAIAAVRQQHPRSIVVAVPVAPASACRELAQEVEELVTLIHPDSFYAVSSWYQEFPQVSDEEACQLLTA